jgi:hypothetical protein
MIGVDLKNINITLEKQEERDYIYSIKVLKSTDD